MYNREISKEDLAKYIWNGWLGNQNFPDDVIKSVEEGEDIPWMDLHIVVKKDLSKVGILTLKNPKIKKGFSGFQKVKGVTILILCADNANVGIYHDSLRLRAIEISGNSVEEKKKDISKKIKTSFKFVEEVKVKPSTKRKAKSKKKEKEVIEERSKDTDNHVSGTIDELFENEVVENTTEEIIEEVIDTPDGEIIEEDNDDK